MKTFSARRWRNIAILVVLAALLVAGDTLGRVSLHSTSKIVGWILAALIVGLAMYNVRKKLPFLPLGSSAAWLQLHVYAGLLTIVLFVLHIGWRIPGGVLESVLAALYVAVAGSGIAGMYLSRSFARRLTTRGGEVIFERIPAFRKRLQNEVEELVLRSVSETDSTAIPTFYTTRLKSFFEKPQNFFSHLAESHRPRRELLLEIQSQNLYLNEMERELLDQVADRLWKKDDLDYQYALQATLKYWLFVHVPLTYALLVFGAFHVLLVHSFSGGIR